MSILRPYDLVIFDYNGTLTNDIEHVYEHGVKAVFTRFGVACPSLETYRANISSRYMETFYWPFGIPLEVSVGEVDAAFYLGIIASKQMPDLFPDTIATLVELRRRGYRLALVSAHIDMLLQMEVRRLGLDKYFDVVVGDARDKLAGFLYVAHRMCGAAAVNLAVTHRWAAIGDIGSDATSAAAVGAFPFLCPRGYALVESLESEIKRLGTGRLIPDLHSLLQYLP